MSEEEVPSIKIKEEKVDPEIEQKIKSIAVKVEKNLDREENRKSITEEKTFRETSDTDDSRTTEDVGENVDDNVEQKNIEPVKSSNEILSELFRVFNAALPEELLNDKDLLKKTHKYKKHKKEKKKKRKKSKVDEDEVFTDGNSVELAGECEMAIVVKYKHRKKKKHKDNKDKKNSKDKNKSREKSKELAKDKHPLIPAIKTELAEQFRDTCQRKRRRPEDPKNVIALKKNRSPQRSREKEHRHTRNSFYNGVQDSKCESDDRERVRYVDIKTKPIDLRASACSKNFIKEDGEISEISLSDEETFLKERERDRGHGNNWQRRTELGDRSRITNSFYAGLVRSRSRDRNRQPNQCGTTRRRSRHRTRSRSRSRARDLGIDKKRLLEIARKNAISMFKRGSLPGCSSMSEEVKDKVLLKMRYGGRTVQDLTDFCKKISNGDLLSELSSDEDSDVVKNTKTKAFHHPFIIREREPIIMNIRNSTTTIPHASEDKTKAITMQFPVSSGQQHRKSEIWMPVQEKLVPLPVLPSATQSTTIFKNITRNVFEKPIPPEDKQEPAFKQVGEPPPSTADVDVSQAGTQHLPDKLSSLYVGSDFLMPPVSLFVPDVPVPSSTPVPNDSVFPHEETTSLDVSLDVSCIISKRLNAMRRLQENPMDSEAIKMIYNSQREMTLWAKTKHLPGQFTGSTGANLLRPNELNSGPQIWARRDQLTSSQPVTGGMGMQLLQKMGWKPGEGLGRQKTGALQPLLLDVKLDKRGLISKEDTGNRRPQPAKRRGPNNVGQAQLDIQNKHPVCLLNELTSKRKWTPPLYTVINEAGPAHSKLFLFSVQINGLTYTPDKGSNTKKEAKLLAARHCLQQIGFLPQQ